MHLLRSRGVTLMWRAASAAAAALTVLPPRRYTQSGRRRARALGPGLIAITIFRPVSDVVTTGWTASTGTSLSACVDELTLNRSDYITSPYTNQSPAMFVADLNGAMVAGTWTVQIDARYLFGASQVRMHLKDSGGTDVGVSAWQTLTASDATYTLSLTTTGTATRMALEVE